MFFGYCGGGCLDYGYFWLNNKDELRILQEDWNNVPATLRTWFERLDVERQSFEDWSDEDVLGRPAERGMRLVDGVRTINGDEDLEYSTAGFDSDLARRVSEQRDLTMRFGK
jgi:hypothetical protein